MEKAGYTVTSGYTAVRDPEKTKFVYRDELWNGADLVGLGVASFSHIAGMHFQNITEFTQYIEAIQRGDLPISRAMATTQEERMIRELILQMKLGRVSQPYFREKFASNVPRAVSPAVRRSARARVCSASRATGSCSRRAALLQSRHAAARLLSAAAPRRALHMIARCRDRADLLYPLTLFCQDGGHPLPLV